MDFNTLYQIIENSNRVEEILEQNSIVLKKHEVESLKSFLTFLFNENEQYDLAFCTENFVMSYIIPQIGEEFDILRLGSNYNLNIELKSKFDKEKMKNQLLRKEHYLKFLNVPSVHISFSSDNGDCFILQNGDLVSITSKECFDIIKDQDYLNCNNHKHIDSFFDINNYLISPFNTTNEFVNGEYFLTSHQQNIKKSVLQKTLPMNSSHLIEGAAGTGKTLLLYDLIKEVSLLDQKYLAFHCGSLNSGHHKLIENGFHVKHIKEILNIDPNQYDVIFIDESQRLRSDQFKVVKDIIVNKSSSIILSIDKEQCLHKNEIDFDIRSKLDPLVQYSDKLNSKIRSNVVLSKFIKMFFEHNLDNNESIVNDARKITLKYFKSYEQAQKFISMMSTLKDFKHITYATSRFDPDPLDEITSGSYIYDSSHKVIGQEFKKVILSIDNNFGYKLNNKKNILRLYGTSKSYYHSTKMLFQNMTRTREDLCIVFIGNENAFDNATKMLSNI